MPRVVGIDPGTVSVDVCGLDDGRLFLDRTIPTAEALASPALLLDLLAACAPLDLVAGPSGYGLPLVSARELTEADIRLAYLAADGESGGIGGLRSLMRALAASPAPIVLLPGVIHLASVPASRKVNRVDMGTADKVCAVALALHDYAGRRSCALSEASFVLLELGGAFSAVMAVRAGAIVDGAGGTSGPLGLRAAGALDGEVAWLAGTLTKATLFGGGAASIAETPQASFESLVASPTASSRLAWEAYLDSAVKATAAMAVSAPEADEVVLSGRVVQVPAARDALVARLIDGVRSIRTVHVLQGFAAISKQAAQGAALIADGLAGGRLQPLVEALGLRDARGTVLDHLFVISRDAARTRLGLA